MPNDHLDVSGLVWGGFVAYVVTLLLIDLLWFNRKSHKIEWGEAARISAFFILSAVAVNVFVWLEYGATAGLTFFTGYLVEVSLSVDNLFVIAVLFGYFGVPAQYQHRVLFWGIFGAVVMRAVMIFLGVALINRFEWVLYVFGVFLLLTGMRMLITSEVAEEPGQNRLLRTLRRVLPVTKSYHGEQFFIKRMGRRLVTPLFLVLVMIELTDVVFAVDSIPAILGITTDPFLAFSSNIMAIVGLRALYFLLAGIIERVRYLHYGLGLVLVFIGAKMLAHEWVHVPTWVSLSVITSLIGASALFSWAAAAREHRRGPRPRPDEPVHLPGADDPGPAPGRSDLAPPLPPNGQAHRKEASPPDEARA
ncbi:MAG TPA: TerC family protein [Rubricoccaceae bacterium]|nr:TerC family protein [Rubricoccaceae bacterium]